MTSREKKELFLKLTEKYGKNSALIAEEMGLTRHQVNCLRTTVKRETGNPFAKANYSDPLDPARMKMPFKNGVTTENIYAYHQPQ